MTISGMGAYIGVDHEYRQWANEGEKPHMSDAEAIFLEEHGLLTDVEAGHVLLDDEGENEVDETEAETKRLETETETEAEAETETGEPKKSNGLISPASL